MAAPDFPVHLDEAVRALDCLHGNLRGTQVIRQFLASLEEMQPIVPLPPLPLEDYCNLETAYALGAKCLDPHGELIVIRRSALLEMLRTVRRD